MERNERSVRALTTLAPALSFVLGVAGCGATNQDNPDINVNPLSQEEATISMPQIKARSSDPLAQVALRQLMPALDRLNGLVARVEVEPGTFVSFYEPSPGQVLISERGPLSGRRVVSAAQSDGMSVLDFYRQLAKAEPPAALVAAYERELAQTAAPSTKKASGAHDASRANRSAPHGRRGGGRRRTTCRRPPSRSRRSFRRARARSAG